MKYRTAYYAEGVYDSYFFEKNLQGDIVAIYDGNGNQIGQYTYDAWGKVTVSYGSNNNVVTNLNPFRYRGYYYDVETGFYYLQSRYYNPSWGRFLNADGYVSTGQGLLGYNMYAYCNNNPVMNVDPTGEIPWLLVAVGAIVAIKVAVNYVSAAISSIHAVGSPDIKDTYTDDEAVEDVNKILSNYQNDEGKSPKLKIQNGENSIPNFSISDSYLVDSVDRMKICTILSRTDRTNRSAWGMAAEWQGHNILYNLTGNKRSKDVNLDFDFWTNDWYTIIGTWVAAGLGEY